MKVFRTMAAMERMVILWLIIPLLGGCEKQAPEYQVIAPDGGTVVASASTVSKDLRGDVPQSGNVVYSNYSCFISHLIIAPSGV